MAEVLFPVGIVMQRRLLANRWQSEQWEAVEIRAHDPASANGSALLDGDALQERWLWTGLAIELVRSETENYLLNITSPDPKVFVLWRFDEAGRAEPKIATVSYGEAARYLDAGEQVDGVAMPREVYRWVAEFAERHWERPRERRAPDYARASDGVVPKAEHEDERR